MPVTGLVKVGPPNEPPEASVSARDVSVGGLFIDADRPVRVGARFSAVIPLSDGGEVYIAEAAVAYNRVRSNGSGFGVRFVRLDDEAVSMLKAEIDGVAHGTIGADLSSAETLIGLADSPEFKPDLDPDPDPDLDRVLDRDLNVEIGAYDGHDQDLDLELGIDLRPGFDPGIEDAADSDAALDGFDASAWHLPNPLEADHASMTAQSADGSNASGAEARAGRRSRLWKGMIIVALGSCATVAVVAWFVTSAPLSKSADDASSRGLSASTHRVLMGESVVDPLDRPASRKPTSGESVVGGADGRKQSPGRIDKAERPRRPLPPLVPLDTVAKTRGFDALLVADDTAQDKSKPGTGGEANAEAKAKAKAPSNAHSKTEAKPAAGGVSSSSSPGTYDLRLSTAAQVMRTYVFRDPERFVVDIVDHEGAVEIPAVMSPVTSIRVGRHDGFTRVVFDAKRAIHSGRVTKLGDRLTVFLRFEE
ncbi:MAG: PilZ domain-containing protein [Deltaproteobacteria bacterium]|nr:PilZ domain-containing protein [Deltaproteobacteria bacterium]